jgi:hypothetical protein
MEHEHPIILAEAHEGTTWRTFCRESYCTLYIARTTLVANSFKGLKGVLSEL